MNVPSPAVSFSYTHTHTQTVCLSPAGSIGWALAGAGRLSEGLPPPSRSAALFDQASLWVGSTPQRPRCQTHLVPSAVWVHQSLDLKKKKEKRTNLTLLLHLPWQPPHHFTSRWYPVWESPTCSTHFYVWTWCNGWVGGTYNQRGCN